MPAKRKRSVSLPPDLDALIEQAAIEESTSYSGWLAMAARKEFTIRTGLASVADFEAEHGAFTDDERADAARWADQVLAAKPAVRRASRKRSA